MARIDYVELPSVTAHELTRGFYSKAFGWQFTDFGPDYASTTTGDVDLGLNGQPAEALAAPLPVIKVEDLEATLDSVATAGGVISRPTPDTTRKRPTTAKPTSTENAARDRTTAGPTTGRRRSGGRRLAPIARALPRRPRISDDRPPPVASRCAGPPPSACVLRRSPGPPDGRGVDDAKQIGDEVHAVGGHDGSPPRRRDSESVPLRVAWAISARSRPVSG